MRRRHYPGWRMHTLTGTYRTMFIAVGACSLTAALLFAAADTAHRNAPAVPACPPVAGGCVLQRQSSSEAPAERTP